jgi:PD-(D/E)XK nuclease superfamily
MLKVELVIKKIKEIFSEAHKKINEAEEEKEGLKVGTLRAGSSGALVKGGMALYSGCGRLAQARLLRYQAQPTEQMRLMFNGGLTLEDYIESRLQASNINYIKEETVECNIEGMVLSGRPDFQILVEEDELQRYIGIEVKSLASPFSVIKQRKNGFPFMKHLIQAATYMLMTERDEWLICIGHSFYVNQNGKKHDPDLKWYRLVSFREFNRETLYVENEMGEMKQLPFDFSHIIAYYKEVRSKTDSKVLMARPTELELNVDTYNRCRYCYMDSACNEYEVGQITFEDWLERIKAERK